MMESMGRVHVVRNWLGPACADWTRGCYPPRRGLFIVWGWLLPIWAVWQFVKFWIYGAGIALMLLAFLPWIVAELLTYRYRLKRAAVATEES